MIYDKIKNPSFISFGINNDEIADLETAKQLKLNGFDKPTYNYWLDKDFTYLKSGLKRVKSHHRRMNHNRFDEFIYSAPNKKDLNDWLNKNILYQFLYCGCIHESSYATISLHKTLKGAEIAMEFHKNEKKKEYDSMVLQSKECGFDDYSFNFGACESWVVQPIKILK